MAGLVTRACLSVVGRPLPRYVSYQSRALSRDVSFLAGRVLPATTSTVPLRTFSTSSASPRKVTPIQRQENKRGYFPYLALAASLILGGGFVYTTSREQERLDLKEETPQPLTNRELEKKLHSQDNILDLSGVKLSKEDLQELAEWLHTHTHHFVRINWGEYAFSPSCVEMQKIQDALQNTLNTFQERPSSYECAQFCSLAYQNAAVLKQGGSLPDNWELLDVQDTAASDGYFGAAFVNHQTGQIILSHRGTDQLFHDLQTDVLGVVGGIVERQQASAIAFSYQVLRRAEKLGYRVGMVGHSLGGWLAQLTACLAISKGYQGIYVLTLDSPGAKSMIDTYFMSREAIPMMAVDPEQLDFTHYVSLPNIVNTCHPHVGDLFHILPDQKAFHLSDRVKLYLGNWMMPAAAYTYRTHTRAVLLPSFDPTQPHKIYKVLHWPELKQMGGAYYRFFAVIQENFERFPLLDTLTLNDRYLVRHIARYDVTEAQHASLSLRHFSPILRKWLTQFKRLEEKDVRALQDTLGIQDNRLLTLSQFEMEKEEVTVRIPGKSAGDFRRDLSRLLTTYPELVLRVIEPERTLSLQDFSLLTSNETKGFIRSCETIIPSRLYLFAPAAPQEIDQHRQDAYQLADKIAQREALLKRLPAGKASYWAEMAQDQISQLKIMQAITEVLIQYKSRNFQGAKVQSTEALKLMEEYTNPHLQLPRLRASLHSLRAKMDRSLWRGEKDLVHSAESYEKALDPTSGLPHVASLWSNYGALLNNWGEYLSWAGRGQEAVEKHTQALAHHKRAHALSLKHHWIFLDTPPDNEGIKRDYGRALYLLAKEEYDQGKITPGEYHAKVRETLPFFSVETSASPNTPAVTHLFKGIALEELEDIEGAFACYEQGLQKRPNHVTLLYRRGNAYLKKGEYAKALIDAEKSKEKFLQRGIETPEDTYRLEQTEALIKTIREQIEAQ